MYWINAMESMRSMASNSKVGFASTQETPISKGKKMWHMFLYEEEYPEIENRVVEWLAKQLK